MRSVIIQRRLGNGPSAPVLTFELTRDEIVDAARALLDEPVRAADVETALRAWLDHHGFPRCLANRRNVRESVIAAVHEESERPGPDPAATDSFLATSRAARVVEDKILDTIRDACRVDYVEVSDPSSRMSREDFKNLTIDQLRDLMWREVWADAARGVAKIK